MEDTHVLDQLKVNSYVQSMGHTIFIDESIAESTYYRSVISTLASAQEGDNIRMIIDSNGGFGSTAMTITHAMDQCNAKITAVLSGNCKSAATLIALHAHDWEVGAGLDWLAHTASFGVGGEAPKVQKEHEHQQKLIRELLFREYHGFYSEEEIEDIAAGNDSLLVASEVSERLTEYQEFRQKSFNKYHQEIEDAMWAENNQVIDETLETLPFSEEEKETFNKIRIALDMELNEGIPSTPFEPTEDDLESMLSESVSNLKTASDIIAKNCFEKVIPLLDITGKAVGDIYVGKEGVIEIEVPLDVLEYTLIMNEEFLVDQRDAVLTILEVLTGERDTKTGTLPLVKRLIKLVTTQIK